MHQCLRFARVPFHFHIPVTQLRMDVTVKGPHKALATNIGLKVALPQNLNGGTKGLYALI